MSAVPVERYLEEFGCESLESAPAATIPPRPAGAAPDEDVAARIDAAFARGLESGRAEAHAETEQRIADQRRMWDGERAAERLAWADDQASRLSQSLKDGLSALEARIATLTARALAPLVEQRLRARAVADLEAVLHRLLAHQEGLALEASGPPDLVESLREKVSAQGIDLSIVPSGGSELRVKAGHTVLETCVADWAARVREAIR